MPTAATTDLLKKYKSLFSTTLSTGIGTGTGDTITPASVTGLPTDTLITLTFDRVDSGGVATPTKLERIQGIISGGNFTSYTRGIDGTTEQAHAGGAVIEMIWNADDWNDAVDWGLAQHNQLGGHTNITASNITASGTTTATTLSAGNITASATTSSLHFKAQASGDFLDANANELFKFTQTASAVNEFTVANAATSGDPLLSVTGGDANVNLALQSKGTGVYKLKGTSDTAAELQLYEDVDNGTNYIGLKAPASVSANKTFVLPGADGTAGQFIKTDGSANLSFASAGNAAIVDEDDSATSSTTSSTYANITGADVSLTLTATSHIVLIATVSAYQNAGSTKAYSVQLHDGSGNIGVEVRADLATGNARTCITCQSIVQSKAAGTYTYTLQHRSQDNATSITAEVVNFIAFSIPA